MVRSQTVEPIPLTVSSSGTNRSTEIEYWYGSTDFDEEPVRVGYTKEGDGLLPLKSMENCVKWTKSDQTESIVMQTFDMKGESNMLEDEAVIHYILDIITAQPS